MIQWVYERVMQAKCFDAVIVATDNSDILNTIHRFGGQAEMTKESHVSGTDRIWEVIHRYSEAQYIFNIQGDEPWINPHYLEEASAFLKTHHDHADIVTLKTPILNKRELEDPNVVKVVTNAKNKALYFSRAPIPFARDNDTTNNPVGHHHRHIGIYGFTRPALEQFVNQPVSPLEHLEKLEQLRALEMGMSIFALPVPEAPIGVDTPEDLKRVEALIQEELVS